MRRLRNYLHVCLLVTTLSALMGSSQHVFAEQLTTGNEEENPPDISHFEATGLTISKRVDEVNLVFTVTDSGGKFISNLPASQFDFLDNQRKPRSLGYFQQQTNLPLRVALLIDLSDSVRGRFQFEQRAASVFLKNILRRDVDQAFIVGFDGDVHLVEDMTSDSDALAKAIHSLKSNGDTALYDALVFSAEKLSATPEARVTRRAIILITDGLDTRSTKALADAQEAATRANAVLYALSTNSLLAELHPKGDVILNSLALPTGGHILAAREESDLKRAFREVEKALRSQYALGYIPADFKPDGSFRTIAIHPRKSKLKVQCRKGHFAPVETASH